METIARLLDTPLEGPVADVGVFLVLTVAVAACFRWIGRGGGRDPGEW